MDDREDEDVELVEPVNQYMTFHTLKFEVVYVNDQYEYNDCVDSHAFIYLYRQLCKACLKKRR